MNHPGPPTGPRGHPRALQLCSPLYHSTDKNPSARLIQLPIYSLHMCRVCLWHVYLYKFLFASFIKYRLGVGLGGVTQMHKRKCFISRGAPYVPPGSPSRPPIRCRA